MYRVCLIEPAVVNTGMLVEVGNQLSAALRIDTTEDLDRQQIAFWVNARSGLPKATPADIADAIVTRCIDVEKPVLRHLLTDNMEPIALSAADLTGELGISIASKLIGSS